MIIFIILLFGTIVWTDSATALFPSSSQNIQADLKDAIEIDALEGRHHGPSAGGQHEVVVAVPFLSSWGEE